MRISDWSSDVCSSDLAPAEALACYGPKQGNRVLVLGQVEVDMSILKGCDRPITNNELVSIAASENPDAQIIYKPHPEVIRGTRQDSSHSSPRDVEHIADVIYEDISLADALDTVDHVYKITDRKSGVLGESGSERLE